MPGLHEGMKRCPSFMTHWTGSGLFGLLTKSASACGASSFAATKAKDDAGPTPCTVVPSRRKWARFSLGDWFPSASSPVSSANTGPRRSFLKSIGESLSTAFTFGSLFATGCLSNTASGSPPPSSCTRLSSGWEAERTRIADAIWWSEGAWKASRPYGWLTKERLAPKQARAAVLRWLDAKKSTFVGPRVWATGCQVTVSPDWIKVLADAYCPPSTDRIGNARWKKNVSFFIRNPKPVNHE